MLCGIRSTSDHHHHSLLRSFRSHRSLRHPKNSQESFSSEEEMHHHHRQPPSDASSQARPSLDSTSSGRTDMSIDWDPLRLHPSVAAGPAPPLRDAFSESTSRRYQPHELRHARSSQALRQPSSPSHQHRPASNNTVIYDGFDFGFNNNPTPPTLNTTSPSSRGMMARAPSPTPSDASSECSLSLGGSLSDDSSPVEVEEMGLCLGLAPAPVPRPRARPRPRLDDSGNDAESYIRRGGWKRRGIVFVNSEAPLAGEDETFEI
jgi:hypothetical protein